MGKERGAALFELKHRTVDTIEHEGKHEPCALIPCIGPAQVAGREREARFEMRGGRLRCNRYRGRAPTLTHMSHGGDRRCDRLGAPQVR